MNILLISPEFPKTYWSFWHALKFVGKKASIPPLGLLTVAALLPREWKLRVVDMNVSRLRDSELRQAEVVMISAMLVHEPSVREVVKRCVAMRKRVIAGGPLFTTGHESFPEIQHFVLGEAEELMPQVVADLKAGNLQPLYQATNRPSMTLSPIPRWDLINLRHYVTMAVQFSRGCPFDCEFCDIIVMNGRVPRTKTPEQVINELELLRRLGWRDMVFIVDDNFIGNKKQTKELLYELINWRQRTRSNMGFLTEASVNLANDDNDAAILRALMVEAGFTKVFVGIETPVAESLAECHKFQNEGRDLVAAVQTLQRAGLQVMGGFIVGFDNDQPDIFKRQFEFIQHSGVVTAMVGLLSALPQTRLYQRLEREGRLETKSSGNNTDATLNFRPKLNKEFLQNGYRELMKKLYAPNVYYQRVLELLRRYKRPRVARAPTWSNIRAFLYANIRLGIFDRGWFYYWTLLIWTVFRRPWHLPLAVEFWIIGHHFRQVAKQIPVIAGAK